MKGQFPDKKTVGIPPDFVLILDETKGIRDQTKKLLDDEKANEAVRVANENARKAAESARQAADQSRANAEATRVVAERGRVQAEVARQKRFEKLAKRLREIEDVRARVAKVERRIDGIIADYELVSLAIDTLGRLHNDVEYLYLNYGMHFAATEAHIQDGILVYDGALFQDGHLNYSGIINERNIPGTLPPGADYAVVGEGMLFAADKMHIEEGIPVFDDATAADGVLSFPGIIKKG